MAYWLVKSEPGTWSWDDQVAAGVEPWDGVRNHQAAGNMRAMRLGDRAFFYHSGQGKEIVGIVEVAREFYPDPKDETGKFGLVDMRTIAALPAPVTLQQIKGESDLAQMVLVRNSRLSVQPVAEDEWRHVCRLAGADPG
ncbi:MAG: EVE domain-containing protein [Rhodospirillaceae bacterium]|nr:EVE domain-containing protein [Rhodospirillaceae bacterium]